MLSVPKVAAALGISRASAYELAHRKSFPAMLSKQINTNKGWPLNGKTQKRFSRRMEYGDASACTECGRKAFRLFLFYCMNWAICSIINETGAIDQIPSSLRTYLRRLGTEPDALTVLQFRMSLQTPSCLRWWAGIRSWNHPYRGCQSKRSKPVTNTCAHFSMVWYSSVDSLRKVAGITVK